GMNTVAGYWPGSSNTEDAVEYLKLVDEAKLYGVMPFDKRLKGHPSLLAYIHEDEPDLPRRTSDAEVVPGESLKLNSSTPLWRLVDGVTHSWSVLDPLQGASVTIRVPKPVTVRKLGIWLTVSSGLAVAKEVSFMADGKEILRATLEAKKGRQTLRLDEPVTLKSLTLTVRSTYPGKHEWGSISEIEGYNEQGENVLVAPPRYVPRSEPRETLCHYRTITAADRTRPVFLTLTGHFHPHFDKWPQTRRRELYPRYLQAADVVGYDIYPIYGWNKPEWIHLVYDATQLLTSMAGDRPVYAWIETSKGGQYTGPLERQKEVTPKHIQAEVWMAICGGATAIGYFTHVWKPEYKQFGVPEKNRKALREINDQLTRLAPAILDKPADRTVTIRSDRAGEAVKLAVLAKRHEGELWVFAVNYDEKPRRTQAVISVEELAAEQAITVIDEERTIRSESGGFRDVFEPLDVHLYRLKPE
ncbi:MAG: hypothetical protein ACOC7K_02580, partial [bacterium]